MIRHLPYYVMAMILLLAGNCRKPYEPPVLVKGDNYLVVDGFINTAPNGTTTITLTRTKNLTDTVVTIPEINAEVQVQGAAGNSYGLHSQNNDNVYTIDNQSMPPNTQYKILIKTSNGKRYESDLVASKQTPAIDDVPWSQDSLGVHVYVNTHDATNNTRFYRWQYVQTWEYHSQLETPWGLNGNKIYVKDLSEISTVCYRSDPSTSVLLGTSAALSQDIMSMVPLFRIPPNDSTLGYRMSIQVLQYAMTPQAYFYWQIIQKNSQELGTLFDLQPSQLEGNIHCIDNPTEPVVGFLSAGTMQDKRIFIKKDDLQDWVRPPGNYPCVVKVIPQDPVDFSVWSFPDRSYRPWYFAGGDLLIAKQECLDCRFSGGSIVKPSFW